ncbi:MAG: hypothetical protein PHV13_03020 [Candidatus ainarchaeum sp.]|nr:hypothetical protein [Candidatus ainarchaeum sp.]
MNEITSLRVSAQTKARFRKHKPHPALPDDAALNVLLDELDTLKKKASS